MELLGSLTLSSDDVVQGARLTCTYSVDDAQVSDKNWVGVWPDNGSGPPGDGSQGSTGSTTWEYAPGASGSVGLSSGALTPGKWLAYYLHDDGYEHLAAPVPFRVRAMQLLPEPPYLGAFGAGRLTSPAGISVGEDGAVWVADTYSGRVHSFDARYRWSRELGKGVLREPRDVAVRGRRVYVADSQKQTVEVFNLRGHHQATWGKGTLGKPRGVAVTRGGEVLVSDVGNNRVVRLRNGREVGEITTDVHIPHGLHVAGDAVWVVSSSRQYDGDSNVTRYVDGEPDGEVGGGQHSKYGGLSNPAFVALHPGGDVLVSVPDYGWVNQYSADGAFRCEFATTGAGLMRFPQGLAVTKRGEILVADTGNHRIVRFGSAS